MEEENVVNIHIYGARAISSYFVFPNTLSLSNYKWKLALIDQYSYSMPEPC